MKLNSTIHYLFLNWFLIIITVIICQMFPGFYIVGFFFIASRQFAIYLVGHEGVHYLISKNKRINELLSKYLCLFPVMVSLNMYRDNHLAHHRFIGTAIDPDKNLYNQYPLKKTTFIKHLVVHFLSLKMLKDFLRYFTPFYIILKARNTGVFKKKDFIEIHNFANHFDSVVS